MTKAANDSIRVNGVGREASDPRTLVIYFNEKPSDNDMQRIHDLLRDGASQAPSTGGTDEPREGNLMATAEHWLEKAHVAMAALRELVACKDLKDAIAETNASPFEGVDPQFHEYRRRKPLAWAAARAVLNGDGYPTDPLDRPLPCDITVGHVTMAKGVKLGTLVLRMKGLYKMATGEDADEVANLTPEEREARRQAFLAIIEDPQAETFKRAVEGPRPGGSDG